MTNIIPLRVPPRRQALSARTDALAAIFAQHRRDEDCVFWLKENAEFLNIMECTGTGLSDEALAHWQGFYEDLPKRLAFFPQYYRFLLSIALDLEDLGLPGNVAEAACAQVARAGYAEAELSDLQRAEARRLLARRGLASRRDDGIDARLRDFIGRATTFTVPNKKAAYELTHIIFYLSEYGRRDPDIPATAIESLEYVGILAVLEQNMDLLAEVCIALRFAGQVPSPDWEDLVQRNLGAFGVETAQTDGADDYHEYLVSCWSACLAGDAAQALAVRPEPTRFLRPYSNGPLRRISSLLMDLDTARSPRWQDMRELLYDYVDDADRAVLDCAERTSANFNSFFEGFARAGRA